MFRKRKAGFFSKKFQCSKKDDRLALSHIFDVQVKKSGLFSHKLRCSEDDTLTLCHNFKCSEGEALSHNFHSSEELSHYLECSDPDP
jgi:hypothetical protein